MKKAVFQILVLLAPSFCKAQDLSGTWEGVFNTDMDFRGIRRSFFLHMELQQEGKRIDGMFYTGPLDAPHKVAVSYKISGKAWKKDSIPSNLMVERVLYNTLSDFVADVFWQFDDIRYLRNDTLEILYGFWLPKNSRSPRSDGAGGTFRVSRRYQSPARLPASAGPALSFAERTNRITDSMSCRTKTVEVELFDNGVVDGDSVSLYLNGKPVLTKQKLGTTPVKANLLLQADTVNNISLFAENLGSIPPNTAMLRIRSSCRTRELFIAADMCNNATIIIDTR